MATTPPTNDPTRWLPTLARARGERLRFGDGDAFELPEGDPTAQQRLAAIVLHARVVRREAWEEATEMSPSRASYLLREMPPAPRDFAEESYLVRLGFPSADRRCTSCDLRRLGATLCHRCGGNYLVGPERCVACEQGFIPCATCDGAGRAVDVKVRYVNDVVLTLHDVLVPETFRYVPSLFAFGPALREVLSTVAVPDMFAFDLSARTRGGSAYRDPIGGQSVDPVFHEHRFGEALEAARGALRSMVKPKTSIVLWDVRSYAWPFVWLEYGRGPGKRDYVITLNADGSIGGWEGRPA